MQTPLTALAEFPPSCIDNADLVTRQRLATGDKFDQRRIVWRCRNRLPPSCSKGHV